MAAYKASEKPNHIMHAVALSLSDEEPAPRTVSGATPTRSQTEMRRWTRRELGGLTEPRCWQ